MLLLFFIKYAVLFNIHFISSTTSEHKFKFAFRCGTRNDCIKYCQKVIMWYWVKKLTVETCVVFLRELSLFIKSVTVLLFFI